MLVEIGFQTAYEVHKIRSIRAVKSGDFQGNKYGASVQFKSINIEQVDDPELGLVEKEVILIFKIPCDDRNLRKFNEFLRKLSKQNKPFVIHAGLPSQTSKDTYQVKSYQTAEELMETLGTSSKAA